MVMSSPGFQSTAAPPPEPPRRPGIVAQLDKFWLRVTEGMEVSQLWKQFQTDARVSYRVYQKDFSTLAPKEGRKRVFQIAQEFAWAILEKLTPARRVLLLLGVLLLVLPGGAFQYHGSSGEVEVAEFDFHFFGGVLLFILLMLEIADRVVMKRDLEIARDIQKWLLPATPPQVPGLGIAFATRPANTVAGDYYDVFARPVAENGHAKFLLTVADVAGKSMPAALLMATFQASLKTLSSVPCSLPELVDGMNRYASTNSQSGLRFITGFLAEFSPADRKLTYINAGHNAPILRRNSGVIERLTSGGMPLGIMAGAIYQPDTVQLETGDWLVIFTDGLVEAMNTRGLEYDEQRVLNVLQSGIGAAPEELLQRLMRDLDAFVGDAPQHDDVTCLLVKVD